ncbi:MAG: hypothetical protein VX498_00040 [Myxococcota bacterium]|nr:hypothetical protein [Myxococcota bacterium]
MGASVLVHSLVLTPFFASRAFLATFLVAMFARFGPKLSLLDPATRQILEGTPGWMTHGATLGALGALTVLEFAATKNQDARVFLNEVDSYIKAALSFAVTLALVDAASLGPIEPVLSGPSPLLLWAVVPSSLVFVMSRVRSQFIRVLAELDPDDAIGIQSLLALGEDCWVLGGFGMVVLLPFMAISLFVATLVGLFVLHRFARWLENRDREPCPDCLQPVHPSAPHCGSCGRTRPLPLKIGFFGQPRRDPADDAVEHRMDLLAGHRCPVCAERLPKTTLSQDCATCSHRTFANRQELDDYVAGIHARLPRTLLMCLLLGSIPLFGIVPGVIWYRVHLVSPVSRYIPRSIGCITRSGLGIFNLLLVSFQPIPILGALALPILCLVNYKVHCAALRATADRSFAPS